MVAQNPTRNRSTSHLVQVNKSDFRSIVAHAMKPYDLYNGKTGTRRQSPENELTKPAGI